MAQRAKLWSLLSLYYKIKNTIMSATILLYFRFLYYATCAKSEHPVIDIVKFIINMLTAEMSDIFAS